jgi:hypothetical protein
MALCGPTRVASSFSFQFLVSGFWFLVSSFWFPVSGFRLPLSGLTCFGGLIWIKKIRTFLANL